MITQVSATTTISENFEYVIIAPPEKVQNKIDELMRSMDKHGVINVISIQKYDTPDITIDRFYEETEQISLYRITSSSESDDEDGIFEFVLSDTLINAMNRYDLTDYPKDMVIEWVAHTGSDGIEDIPKLIIVE
jgi:hypothetical protein